MTLIHHATDIAFSTGAGALAGRFWGPFGQTGGAIYGLTSGLTFKVIELSTLSALRDNRGGENANIRQALKVSWLVLGILATIGSLHCAAHHVGVKLTFKGGLFTVLPVEIFAGIAVFIRNALLPRSHAIQQRKNALMLS